MEVSSSVYELQKVRIDDSLWVMDTREALLVFLNDSWLVKNPSNFSVSVRKRPFQSTRKNKIIPTDDPLLFCRSKGSFLVLREGW